MEQKRISATYRGLFGPFGVLGVHFVQPLLERVLGFDQAAVLRLLQSLLFVGFAEHDHLVQEFRRFVLIRSERVRAGKRQKRENKKRVRV